MIKYEVVAEERVQEKLNRLGSAKVVAALHGVLQRAVFKVQGHIVQNKLNGQVLHRRTGNLGNSITQSVRIREDGVVEGRVGTNVFYGLIHEFGNGMRPFFIFPKKLGGMLAWKGADGKMNFRPWVIHPGFPERSFIRSGLRDKEQEIHEDFVASIRRLLEGQ